MSIKIQSGQLVESLLDQVASYSNYGGRPSMSFQKGMIGVVRKRHDTSIQVEFFSPETGLMEACHCHPENVKSVDWPVGLVDLCEKRPYTSFGAPDWYSCGSMGPMSAINYLKAVARLKPEYYKDLRVDTLRIPGYHESRLRSAEPVPRSFLAQCAGGDAYSRSHDIMLELAALIRDMNDPERQAAPPALDTLTHAQVEGGEDVKKAPTDFENSPKG